jgi:hypothetical protein
MTKRRMTIRRRVRLPLSLGRKLPALTADVSRGGFQAELPQVFVPGSQVDGYFVVDGLEVAFQGTVSWAEAGNPSLSLWSRMGVRFTAFPPGLTPLFDSLEKKPRRVAKKR